MLVTLRKGARWVEFETKINNNVPNHYLQVSFPTDIDTEFVYAQDLGSCRGNYEKTDQRDIMSIVRCIYEI